MLRISKIRKLDRRLLQLLQWIGLLASLTLSIYAATRSLYAPQVILLATLYLIVTNLSLPSNQGGTGLVTIVSVSSLLLLGQQRTVLLLSVSLLLAQLLRPIWSPLWRDLAPRSPMNVLSRRVEHLGHGVARLIALAASGAVFSNFGAEQLFQPTNTILISTFLKLVLGYGIPFLSASFLLWIAVRRPWREFPLTSLGAEGLFSHPFGMLGALLYIQTGIPAFVVFCLSIAVAGFIIWLSWRRRAILDIQLFQFSLLNDLGKSLHEVLDLHEIALRIKDFMVGLKPAERVTLTLLSEDNEWQVAFDTDMDQDLPSGDNSATRPWIGPDDWQRWVKERASILELSPENKHFSLDRGLTPPNPVPQAWLGLPLLSGGSVIGVLVLQSYIESRPFSNWDRQLMLAISAQAAAAIQNARLYQETARLYALTDEALAHRVNELQALLDTIADGVLMLDKAGRVGLVNKMAALLLGVDSEDLQGEVLSPEMMAGALGFDVQELALLSQALLRGEVRQAQPTTFRTGNLSKAAGSLRYVTRIEAPVRSEAGTLLGWLLLFRDVTEERQLAALRVDLTRMIVHDLRNPLTTVISNVDLLETQLSAGTAAPSAATSDLIARVRRSGHDMLDLVDSMMDISRLEAGQSVVEQDAMHLPHLVDKVVQHLAPLSRQKRVSIEFEQEQGLPPVWADEEMIRRVLMNLLDNALKFTPAGGKIVGRLSAVTAPSHENIAVRCLITDSGPGVPAEIGNSVFDRFMRTNQGGGQVRGTGLGLAFCKLAIEAHGGKIWVEEAPERGSCFGFTLPVVPF